MDGLSGEGQTHHPSLISSLLSETQKYPGLLILLSSIPISFHLDFSNTKYIPNLVRDAPKLYTSCSLFSALPSTFSITAHLITQMPLSPTTVPSTPHYRHSLGSPQGGPSSRRGPGEVGVGEALG